MSEFESGKIDDVGRAVAYLKEIEERGLISPNDSAKWVWGEQSDVLDIANKMYAKHGQLDEHPLERQRVAGRCDDGPTFSPPSPRKDRPKPRIDNFYLFRHMEKEHNLILTESEANEIVKVVHKMAGGPIVYPAADTRDFVTRAEMWRKMRKEREEIEAGFKDIVKNLRYRLEV